MTRILPLILATTLTTLSACGGARTVWHPSYVVHVPDSTPVRFRSPSSEAAPRATAPAVIGLSLGWQLRAPRVVTATGDTVVVPAGAQLEVRLRAPGRRTTFGAAIGYLVGVGVSVANCPPPKRYCGEQDPTPILGAGLGALLGAAFRTEQWVRVRWDDSP